MILSEKSATFRDHAPTSRDRTDSVAATRVGAPKSRSSRATSVSNLAPNETRMQVCKLHRLRIPSTVIVGLLHTATWRLPDDSWERSSWLEPRCLGSA